MSVLGAFADELNRIKAELHTHGMSIPQLMSLTKGRGIFDSVSESISENGPMDFARAWESCVSQKGGCLTKSELQAIAQLGMVLGRYALEEQLTAIDRVVEIIMQGKIETQSKLRAVSRLYMGTSLSLSAMLVVLLL